MSKTSDTLFAYLRDIFYATSDAGIEFDKLEEDYVMLAKGLTYFAQCFHQYNDFAKALAKGDLSVLPPPPENELAAPLKSLHASLKHLSWQSKQVAQGDYKQRVDFMGEFSDAFNTMVEQLADRQQKLEDEIELSRKQAKAMEQSNLLLSNLTLYIPQQIFVVSTDNNEILLFNESAQYELERDPDYVEKLMKQVPVEQIYGGSNSFDISFKQDGADRYLTINTYVIQWQEINAITLIIEDKSIEKKQLMELEDHAYRDALTGDYNRFYGMLTLNEWVNERRAFILVFIDLDNLKYVNDAHGHHDGDEYIIRVSRHLREYSENAVVCRLGGDEFMLLSPDTSLDEASRRIDNISEVIHNDEYLAGKEYTYSISRGIVAVDENNELPSSSILSLADERMYEHKRARKKERQSPS